MHESPYREFAPPAALRDLVECTWSAVRVGEPGATHRVLPDGCVDLLFHRGRGDPRLNCRAVGTMTRPLDVPVAAKPTWWLGVRFHPGAAQSLLGDVDGLTDASAPLDALGFEIGELAERLAEEVGALERSDDPMTCRRIERAPRDRVHRFLAGLLGAATPPDPLVRFAVQELRAAGGAVSTDVVARSLGVSRQHLSRRFRPAIGVGPKMFARVLRMRRAVRLLEADRDGSSNLAELALACGFADQAHLTRELRSLTGWTPGQHARRSRVQSAI